MMPPFVVFPTNRIAHFVEVSLYLFYLAQQVNLISSSDILSFGKTVLIYASSFHILSSYMKVSHNPKLSEVVS